LISQVVGIGCHGNFLSPILVIGKSIHNFSSTFGGAERIFNCPCPYGVATNNKSTLMVPIVFLGWDLDAQQGLFKLTMKLNIIFEQWQNGGIGS
jgi:hypothetical protein